MTYQEFLSKHNLTLDHFSFGVWRKYKHNDPNNPFNITCSLKATGTNEAPTSLRVYDWTNGKTLDSWGTYTESEEETKELKKAKKDLENECAIENEREFNRLKQNLISMNVAHPYLLMKGFNNHFPLDTHRVVTIHEPSQFIIPMFDIDGKLWNYQVIKWSEKDQKFTKFFQRDSRTKDLFLAFSNKTIETLIKEDVHFILCEGYATSYAVAKALEIDNARNGVVLCCFSLSNVENVIKVIRSKHHKTVITLGLDNDILDNGEMGPGPLAADNWTLKYQAGVFLPPEKGDWNDYFQTHGAEKILEHLNYMKEELPDDLIILGMSLDGTGPVVMSTRNPKPNILKEDTAKAFSIYADINYFAKEYPEFLHSDEKTGKITFNYKALYWHIGSVARLKQSIEKLDLFGLGFYADKNDNPFIHCGNLIYDGKRTHHIAKFKTKSKVFPHESPRRIDPPKYRNHDAINTTDFLAKRRALEHWLSKCTFVKPKMEQALLGWIVQASYIGALNETPHLSLQGNRASGKTTIIKRIIEPILSRGGVFSSATTVAGWKQAMGHDQIPTIMDEAEWVDDDLRKGKQIILAARAAYNGQRVTRGTQHGKALETTLKSALLLASINPLPLEAADLSRFIQLNMDSSHKKADEAQWTIRDTELNDIFDSTFVEKLYSWLFLHYKSFKKFYKAMLPTLETMLGDTRQAINTANLISGYFVFSSEEFSIERAADILKSWRPFLAATFEEQESPQEEIIDKILLAKVRNITRKHGFNPEPLPYSTPTDIMSGSGERFDPLVKELLLANLNGVYDDDLDRIGIVCQHTRKTEVAKILTVRFCFSEFVKDVTGIPKSNMFFNYYKDRQGYNVERNACGTLYRGKRAVVVDYKKLIAPDS